MKSKPYAAPLSALMALSISAFLTGCATTGTAERVNTSAALKAASKKTKDAIAQGDRKVTATRAAAYKAMALPETCGKRQTYSSKGVKRQDVMIDKIDATLSRANDNAAYCANLIRKNRRQFAPR